MSKPGIFLSHSWHDKQFVRKLNADLRQCGVRTWMDEAEIRVGDSLMRKISIGIDEMDFVAVILSRASISSEWVQREIDVAINQEIEGRRVKILPLLLERCEVPPFLKGKMYADFTSDQKYETAFQQVLAALGVSYDARDHQRKLFIAAADHRLRGTASSVQRLSEIIEAHSIYASRARAELAIHEFARAGEHQSLPTIVRLSEGPSGAFESRAFSLLRAMCLISMGRIDAAKRIMATAPDSAELGSVERAYLALQQAIFSLAVGDPGAANAALKHAWSVQFDSDSAYPPFEITRLFDRALMETLLGQRAPEKIARGTKYQEFRGAAHLSAVSARVMRKSRSVLRALETAGSAFGWTRAASYPAMQGRLRQYEIFLLSNSGTLFPS